MSYSGSISISGHGAEGDDVKAAYADAVRRLRKLEGASISGSISGSGPGPEHVPFDPLNAVDVADEEAES